MDADDSVTRWIGRLETGDQEAARRLWERYFHSLVRLARQRLRHVPRQVSDEEDVALSAFHAFCHALSDKRMPAVRDRDDLWRILALIVVGKSIDQRRRQFSLKRGAGEAILNFDDLDPAQMEAIIGREPDPALAVELTEELQTLLNRLPDDQLQQMALRKLDGETNEEIAAHTGTSLRTVARRLTVIRRIWEQSVNPPAG